MKQEEFGAEERLFPNRDICVALMVAHWGRSSGCRSTSPLRVVFSYPAMSHRSQNPESLSQNCWSGSRLFYSPETFPTDCPPGVCKQDRGNTDLGSEERRAGKECRSR